MQILRKIFPLFFMLPFVPKAQSAWLLPLEGKGVLTGNYGEVRPNHFHAGLDFKTHSEKNLPIYAVADGYVSRVKVSTHGYGKALYITHPNGYVSVYGHQYGYNDAIKKYVEAAQLAQETFEIELFPKANELPVKQGEIIGYTGNTGDSEGAHLHFEIRDEKTEVPLNPMRFLNIMDTVAPIITSLAFYNEDYTEPVLIKRKRKADTLSVSTKFGVGVECFDLETAGGNKNNIYKVELFLDDKLFYSHTLDSIPFDLARYVNTYCDYDLKRKSKIKVQKCFIGRNNDLPIYNTDDKKGFVYLDDTLYHSLKVRVYDFNKHSAEENIVVKRIPARRMNPIEKPPHDCLKPYQKLGDKYKIEMPDKSLYADFYAVDIFTKDTARNGKFYGEGLVFEGSFARGFPYQIPFQKNCMLSIKVKESLLKYGEQLCIAEGLNNRNYCGGNFKDGFVTAGIRNFGFYKIDADTVAPKIKYLIPKKKKNYKTGDVIYFKVSDEFSGIGKFRLTVNDVFQLAEYEHKTGMIFFKIRENTPAGKVKVKLVLDDKKNNRAVCETELPITEN